MAADPPFDRLADPVPSPCLFPPAYFPLLEKASIDKVWNTVRGMGFEWNPDVKTSVLDEKDATSSTVGANRTITYKDGTSQTVTITEISGGNLAA